MSTVLARYRNISSYEYFNTALRVRKEVTALVTSAAMPKTYRFVLAVPMAQTARDIVSNIVTANAFYPNTEHNVLQRKRYLTLAVAACETLLQDLQCLADLGVVKLDARRTVRAMDALFTQLFG